MPSRFVSLSLRLGLVWILVEVAIVIDRLVARFGVTLINQILGEHSLFEQGDVLRTLFCKVSC